MKTTGASQGGLYTEANQSRIGGGLSSTIGSCFLRYEPAVIIDDRSGEWMADGDMKTEAAVFHVLVDISERHPANRQRHAKQAPAPQHEPHPASIEHQRHAENTRPKSLAQQMLEAP